MHMATRLIPLALLLAAAACDETPVSLPEPSSVTVAASAMTLAVGDQAPLAAQVVDQGGRAMQGQAVVFSTDNPSVATVSNDGTVRGVAAGTANVSATHGASTATVKVTVTAAKMTVAVPSTAMTLTAGGAAPIGAQVLNASGQAVPGAVLAFSSDNPSVATVGTDGVVRAVGLGTANITAAYGSSTATVRVTVNPDRRGEIQSFEVLADSVVADVRAGVQTVAVRAANGLGQPVCPQLYFRSSDASVATARMGGTCRIEIVPAFAGETTITVETEEGLTDSFRVRVTSTGALAFFSARPTAAQLVAGATVAYTVKVINESGAPVANQRVNLDVSVGSLSATTVTTDSAGTATVQWTLPTRLTELGQTQAIGFRAQLPNGSIVSRTETVFINGASLAAIRLYYALGYGNVNFTELQGTSIRVNPYTDVTIGASGVDQYGNVRVADFTFSFPSGPTPWWGCGGSQGTLHPSGIDYTCFWSYGGTYTLRATAADGQHRSVQVTFQ